MGRRYIGAWRGGREKEKDWMNLTKEPAEVLAGPGSQNVLTCASADGRIHRCIDYAGIPKAAAAAAAAAAQV